MPEYTVDEVDEPVFEEADSKTRRHIIKLGVTTYVNIPRHELVVTNHDHVVKQKQAIIDSLEQDMLKMRQNQAQLVENERNIMRKHIESEFESKMNHLQSQVELLTHREKMLFEEREKYAHDMVNHHVFTLNQQLLQQHNCIRHLEEVNALLRKDTEKRTYSNNTEKGKEGEHMIESYIVDNVPTASIVNTAKVPNSTDFRCVYGNTVILIESKHVANVKKSEIDKFARDVRTNAKSIQGAIFVSITDNVRIPLKRAFDFDMIDGIPCIYITGFASNKYMLLAALHWLELYNRNVKSNALSQQVFDMLHKNIDEWQKQATMLVKHKQTANTLMEEVISMENSFSHIIANAKAQIEAVMLQKSPEKTT